MVQYLIQEQREFLIYLIFSYIQIQLKGVEFTVYLFYHTLNEVVEASLAPGSLANCSVRYAVVVLDEYLF